MTQTAELRSLHRAMGELSTAVDGVRRRYGNAPAVARVIGDVERLQLDVGDLDLLAPTADPSATTVHYISDEPSDPAMWVGVDDEGLGGWHAGSGR